MEPLRSKPQTFDIANAIRSHKTFTKPSAYTVFYLFKIFLGYAVSRISLPIKTSAISFNRTALPHYKRSTNCLYLNPPHNKIKNLFSKNLAIINAAVVLPNK